MNLVERVKKMILSPQSEWEVVSQENMTTADLYKNYIVPLSAIGPIASFIGLSIIGINMSFLGSMRVPLGAGLTQMVVAYILGLVGVFLIALLINALAPTFGGEKNQLQALKVATFSFTPAWVASILQILPSLSILVLLAGLYSLYVLYLGLPVLMKAPKEKAVGYTAVVVVCAFILTMIFAAIAASVVGIGGRMGPAMGRPGMPGMQWGKAGQGEDALSKLQQMGQRMEAANKQMEAAKQSGDPQAQAKAAGAVMSAMMGGQYEPVDQHILKDMLPASVGDLKRTKYEANKVAMGEFKIAKAEAGYSDNQNRNINLTLTDTGGAQMFGALAAWAAVESESENDNGYEKMSKVDGRPTHERFNKNGMNSEYDVVVGNRFLVEARGQQVDMAALKQAVAAVDLGKLDSMKNDGVKK